MFRINLHGIMTLFACQQPFQCASWQLPLKGIIKGLLEQHVCFSRKKKGYWLVGYYLFWSLSWLQPMFFFVVYVISCMCNYQIFFDMLFFLIKKTINL